MKNSKDLTKELKVIWLGRRSLVKTFDDAECNITEIREVLDGDERSNPSDNAVPVNTDEVT